MHLSTARHEDLLGKSCTAHYLHIKQLYALEEHLTVKVTFTLKKSSLNSTSLSRTSPQHALS